MMTNMEKAFLDYFKRGGRVSVFSPSGALLGHRTSLDGALVPAPKPEPATAPEGAGELQGFDQGALIVH